MERYQTRKWVLLASAAAVVLIVIGGLAWAIIALSHTEPPKAANPSAQKPVEIREYLMGDEFRSLNQQEKVIYIKNMIDDESNDEKYLLMGQGMNGQRPTEEQQKYFREELGPVFRKAMFMKIDEYTKLKPDQQVEFMDNLLDRMERMRERAEKLRKEGKLPQRPEGSRDRGGPGGGPGRRGRGPGGSPEGMKRIMDGIEPAQRAKAMKFAMDLMGRMRERGMDPGQGRGR